MLKELLLTGLGAFFITKEKAEEIIKELIKKGESTKEEGNELINSLIEKAAEQSNKLKDRTQQEIKNILDSMDIVEKSELEALRQEVEELKKMIREKQDKEDK